MSQAEDLLDSLSTDDVLAYTVRTETEEHIIIGSDRFIKVPSALKRIAVQHDHNIETVTFDCPRYWDGHDMSKMIIYINYMRADGKKNSDLADNVRISTSDDSIIHFDWTIDGFLTEIKGTISFLVCVKKSSDNGNTLVNHWNSELNREMYVSEGLECEESIVAQYPGIITSLLTRMDLVDKSLPFVFSLGPVKPGFTCVWFNTNEIAENIYGNGTSEIVTENLPAAEEGKF